MRQEQMFLQLLKRKVNNFTVYIWERKLHIFHFSSYINFRPTDIGNTTENFVLGKELSCSSFIIRKSVSLHSKTESHTRGVLHLQQ